MPVDSPRLFDIFKGLLGFQPRPIFPEEYPGDSRRSPSWDQDPYQEDDGLYENDDGQESPFHFGFNIFSGDPLEMHKFFERQFEDMLRNFQGLSTGLGGPWEALPPPPDQPPSTQVEPADPRQRYLKTPHWFDSSAHPQPPSVRTDTDLDNEVREGDWSALLPSGGNEERPHHQPSTFFSSSASTYTATSSPQGRVEERRVVKRSDGAEEVCVTRRLGDQSFTSIVTTMPSGETATTERLVNIDKVEDFEKAWSDQRLDPQQQQPRFPGILPSFFH